MTMQLSGVAGPHPDLRQQVCEMANMLASQSPEQLTWPNRPFVPDDLTVLGQRTWEEIESLNSVIDGGGFSAALVDAKIDGIPYGGMITAGRRPDNDNWSLMSASFGEQPEGRPPAGDTGGSGHRCIGLYCSSSGRSKDVYAVEIEYFDGTLHRAERASDSCVIVYAPADNWDQVNREVTARYLDSAGKIVESYSMTFGTGWRPPEANA